MKIETTDAMIIGGGPAGLAAALALAAKGAKCTVVDFKKPPIDKPCGEGLMPDSLKELAKLGIEIPEDRGFNFDGIRFRRGDNQVESDFPQGLALGVRRKVLHEALVAKAEQTPNISLLWNSRVNELKPGSIMVGEREFAYQWLIGADGVNTAVRKWAKMDVGESASFRYGFRSHYNIEPWTTRMELYWSDIGQMYVTPIGQNEVCVVFLSGDKTMRFEQALRHFPDLQKRLSGAELTSKLQGAITATRMLKAAASGKTALIGDASGSVDAITGEGLALSFRQSFALADAIEKGDLSLYTKAHKSLTKLPARMAQLMLLLDRAPKLQSRIIQALSMTPESFGKLLGAHVGHQSLALTVCREVPRIAWNLIRCEGNDLRYQNQFPILSTTNVVQHEVAKIAYR